jgi:Prokaryotic homologs of the JAB domain
MLRGLVTGASRLLDSFCRAFLRHREGQASCKRLAEPRPASFLPLKRVVLTDDVGRTLFEAYAAHRDSARGDEETGWVLLGIREREDALVLATLPAGSSRNAGVGHVQFNSCGQVVGSRIVRQKDRRLGILGIVHTHPGSLRHPSEGDYRGDSQWVGQLRGGEGVFGIGTADGIPDGNGTAVAYQPRLHVQCLDKLRFSWYALRQGEHNYRALPVAYTLGPDLARPLHSVWPLLEAHADRLDRLCRQQTGMTFEVIPGGRGPALACMIPLAEQGHAVRVVLEDKEVRYFLRRRGDLLAVNPQDDRIDRAVYLLLAELAAQVE